MMEEVEVDTVAVEEVVTGDFGHISVHAVEGISSFQTMRVKGIQGKRSLFILIDSGSKLITSLTRELRTSLDVRFYLLS